MLDKVGRLLKKWDDFWKVGRVLIISRFIGHKLYYDWIYCLYFVQSTILVKWENYTNVKFGRVGLISAACIYHVYTVVHISARWCARAIFHGVIYILINPQDIVYTWYIYTRQRVYIQIGPCALAHGSICIYTRVRSTSGINVFIQLVRGVYNIYIAPWNIASVTSFKSQSYHNMY